MLANAIAQVVGPGWCVTSSHPPPVEEICEGLWRMHAGKGYIRHDFHLCPQGHYHATYPEFPEASHPPDFWRQQQDVPVWEPDDG